MLQCEYIFNKFILKKLILAILTNSKFVKTIYKLFFLKDNIYFN
jgi:hypothetical protein